MKLTRIVSLFLACWLCVMPSVMAASQPVPPKKDVENPSYGNVPVVTPDIPHLPWTMENGVKVFHLTAEIVQREIMPKTDMQPAKALYLWGYNGSCPGPTIEVNEGDRVRVIFHNKLPEDTTVHWHGLEIPINMDGMPYISQPPVKPGGSYTYEFHLHQNGTFFYHSHGAMQEMAGMIGLFIIHPKKAHYPPVQKDFGLVLQEFAVLQNNPIPNSMAMEFNWLTINGKAAPSTTPLLVRQGDRVRIRMINIGMDHHPIHLHGNQFYVTGTEGGRIPQSAWFPGNTIIVGVAQSRDIEFDAIYAGDWMLHCHLPHHMMNNMVSMVGPMSHVGQGMHTGAGMEEGMGIVRQGSALEEDLGPAMGRGMGNTADRDQPTSHSIGHPISNGAPVASSERTTNLALRQDKNSLKGPGYPQDDMMMMPVDAAVAKPHNNYLNPGWSAALQGMMNLVRVLPAAEYDKLQRDIRSGHIDPAQFQKMPGMDHGGHGGMPGMDHSQMQHGQQAPMMDHSKMQHGQQAPMMDHSKMQHGQQAPMMDHSKMQHGQQAPMMDRGKMQHGQQAPMMDHSKMQHGQQAPMMDHSKMQHGQQAPMMDRSKMQHGQQAPMMDHSKMQHGSVRKQAPMDHGMDHGKMQHGQQAPVDHSKMDQGSARKEAPMDHGQMDHGNMPGMDHSKMKHEASVGDRKKPRSTTKPAAQRAALQSQMEASRKQMEASRKQMEASRKQMGAASGSNQVGKKDQSRKEEKNKPSVDHSKMGH